MHILVIGGLGFVGSRLVPNLVAAGHAVTVLDKRQPPAHSDQRSIQADIRELDAIMPAFLGTDLVINLAAEHQDNVRPVSLYDEVNVLGAKNICTAATRAGVERILFTSSVAVYGESQAPLMEDSPPNFFNDYGRTKYEAEQIYRAWRSEKFGRKLSIVRPTVIFGPGNRGNVYNLLHQIKYGPFVMIGDGRNIKSIAHVDNVAAFLLHLTELQTSDEVLLNYSDTPDLSVRQLVTLCLDSLGRPPTAVHIPRYAGMAIGHLSDIASRAIGRNLPVSAVRVRKFCTNSTVDAARARATGFSPLVDLRGALREMIRDHV